MITGVHALIYSKKADEYRAFLRDVLGFRSVDAGEGWLIFALPPSELGVHPTEEDADTEGAELYLLCDDVEKTIAELSKKGVQFEGPVRDVPWGRLTAIRMPGGTLLGMYEPKHPSPLAGAGSGGGKGKAATSTR